jgi:peptidoglycan/LPS O-acetylase OafA/YrhL
MDRLRRIYPLLIIALLVFYAVLTFCVLHPSVSVAYFQYYLSASPAAITR